MEREPRLAAKNDGVARTQTESLRGRGAVVAADAKQAGVAERNRDHRRVEIDLVAILMQAHFGARDVEIGEAGFRWIGIAGEFTPYVEQHWRHRRPWPGRFGMERLIPIAFLVRNPAERSTIRHPNCKRPARFGHARREQRRLYEDTAQGDKQLPLPVVVEVTGMEA